MARECQDREVAACREAYDKCLISGPVGDGYRELACACADEYYGVCIREAGCAAKLMTECVDVLTKGHCDDSSVCGSDCTGDSTKTRIVPVNNYSPNYLRFSACFLRYNDRSLQKFGLLHMDRCDDTNLFFECPYWIPPHTYTALAIATNVTYLRMHACSVSSSGEDDDPALADYTCHDQSAVDYYGTEIWFPPSIDVALTDGFCSADTHCPGSFCDHLRQPPMCAPKRADQFQGPLADFKQPNWIAEGLVPAR